MGKRMVQRGARVACFYWMAGALSLLGCDSRVCPDPELAQGTWIPSGGTSDWAPQADLAATETELCVFDYSTNVIRVFDPLTHEQTVSSTLPYDKLGPSGMAANEELLLVVSGSDGKAYLPIAQLWDRVTDTWQLLDLPDYAPPGQSYQVHWTGEVFIMLGAEDRSNQALGGGAVFDPVSLQWQPLFDGSVDVPETYGRSIWTNHGLFWWTARQPLAGLPEAWLFTPEEGWTAFSTEGGPTSTYYHFPSTDGERVWLFGGQQGSSSLTELWEVDLAREGWKPFDGPPGIRLGYVRSVADRLFMIQPDCDCYSMSQPETSTWSVAARPPYSGWGGAFYSIAGHLVSYGDVGDGWATGQMYTYYPDCEPGTPCE